MYYMNNDAFDYFKADFTAKESIVGGKRHPLGFYAAEALETINSHTADLRCAVEHFKEEFQVFLSARDASSAAVAHQAIQRLWLELRRLPVYDLLLAEDHSALGLIPYMRTHPEEVDEMLTPGTPRHDGYAYWLSKLDKLEGELSAFSRNTRWMLEEYFEPLRKRRTEHYAEAFSAYRFDILNAMQMEEESGEKELTVDLNSVRLDYPVQTSFVPTIDPDTKKLALAEQITFESLASFLYMDLYKGMAAGNLPRRCQHCRRWFLAVGGYNTMYCDRVIPGTNGKTCRGVGAHEKEKAENKKAARKEYQRAYNRLKGRKNRGKLSVDEWNRRVARAQDLRDTFVSGALTQEKYVKELDTL